MTASDIASLELEGVTDAIPELVETEDTLDGNIKDNGRAVKVGTRAFRIVMKFAKPGSVGAINIDSGTLPRGGKPGWKDGNVTPVVFCVPIEWSELVRIVGVKAPRVAITNVVDQTVADASDMLKAWRDVFWQTDGTGTLATCAAGYSAGPPVTQPISGGFGARLLRPGQTVDIWKGTVLEYAGAVIANVYNTVGTAQSVTFTADISGTYTPVAGDLIKVSGLTNGAPVFVNGLPVFNSTSTAGSVEGIPRSNPYVVANGYDCGGANVSLPIFRLMKTQIKGRLGPSALKGMFWHTHSSGVASYEEMGFPLVTLPLADGKAKGLDLLFSGTKTIDGDSIVENIHADNTVWDAINAKSYGKVRFADPYWFEGGTGKNVHLLYDNSTGTPKTISAMWLIDSYQNYNDNMVAGGRLSNAKVATGN